MRQEFKNMAKNYVHDEDLERHEEMLHLSKEMKTLVDRCEKATYSDSLPEAEREAGLEYLKSHVEVLKQAISHPQLKTHVQILLANLVYLRDARAKSPMAKRNYECALELIQSIGIDPLILSLKDHLFDRYDRRISLVATLFDLPVKNYATKEILADSLMKQVRRSRDPQTICKYLETIHRAHQPHVIHYIEEVLENYKLPYDPIIDLWRFSEQNPSDPMRLNADHFLAVMELEKAHPGLCSFLWENFGIVFFGRYPKEVLIAQRAEAESMQPYGVILYAHDDHNGAFNYPHRIQDFYNQIKGQLHLRIVEAPSLLGAVRALVRLNQRYYQNGKGHKIQFIDIGGHGTPDKIQLGEQDTDGSHIQLADLERAGAERIRAYFEEDATAILESCSTGEEDGIGQKLSSLLDGMKVIAPKIPAGTEKISATKDASGKWKFDATYTVDGVKAVYKKGAQSR
jgi:hypothetical protein